MELMPGMFSPLADALCAPSNSLPLSQGGAAGGAARFGSGGTPTAPQPAHEGPLAAEQQPPLEYQDTVVTAGLCKALPCLDQARPAAGPVKVASGNAFKVDCNHGRGVAYLAL